VTTCCFFIPDAALELGADLDFSAPEEAWRFEITFPLSTALKRKPTSYRKAAI
jgi:hypothetical protein